MKRLALLTAWVFGATSLLAAQTLEITPSRALMDEQVVIRAKGLQANERVTIHAQLTDGGEQAWKSEAEFVADADGVVDTSKQAPAKGSYREVSAMGLVWSMMPAEKHVVTYVLPRDLQPQIINFGLIRNGQQVSTAQLEQLQIAHDVRRITIKGTLHGVLFLPSGAGQHPGMLVLGGSEGGLPSPKAAWLASHGFAALALAYFRYEDLPRDLENIPLEYFGEAIAWMMQRPEIAPERIGVMGTSRGGELALQLGSMYPQLKAVVAYVPANVRYAACCGGTMVPYAWTWKGQPLTYAMPRMADSAQAQMTAGIAVEHAQGPIFLIGAEDDGVWHSSSMAEAVADRLHRNHFAFEGVLLNFPHAGHRAGRPEIVPVWHGKMRHPVSGREMDPGGTVPGDAASSLNAIPKVLKFLDQALGNTVELKH
jgi:dienelactone hydrolase